MQVARTCLYTRPHICLCEEMCVHICVSTYTSIRVIIFVYLSIYVCMCTCHCFCVYINAHLNLALHLDSCLCLCLCLVLPFGPMNIHVYECIYIYMYIAVLTDAAFLMGLHMYGNMVLKLAPRPACKTTTNKSLVRQQQTNHQRDK